MKYILLFIFACLAASFLSAQNSLKVKIIDDRSQAPLPGATLEIPALQLGAVSDTNGIAQLEGIPGGEYEIKLHFLGYGSREKELFFPLKNPEQALEFKLEPASESLEQVIVSSTRSSRSILNLPTRIEVISTEELEEKSDIRPGDIKVLLNESTGIATQTTSAASGIANIRIQGLDGRYTQFLKDGMPLFQGFAGGLSVVQIAPLDLRQVEVIKGSSSTLYGGGAIAGLVNLISKTPGEKRELDFLLNATSAKGLDASAFWSERRGKLGGTLFSVYNFNDPYATPGAEFTAVPRIRRFTVSPKFFAWFDEKNSMSIGFNFTEEDRKGGDIYLFGNPPNESHRFLEENHSWRFYTQCQYEHKINEEASVQFKNSFGFFDRVISLPDFRFDAQVYSTFTELSYRHSNPKREWVAGLNTSSEDFRIPDDTLKKDYILTIFGIFGQYLVHLNDRFTLESGLRIDYNSPRNDDQLLYLFALPRLNLLVKWNERLTSRLGGGFGYKMPSIFKEEAEEFAFRNIKPVNIGKTKAEKSFSGNADLDFHGQAGELSVAINQLFFFTCLNKPLILQNNSFVRANGYIQSRGFETSLRLRWEEFHFYAGYTFAAVDAIFDGVRKRQPLAPHHRLNAVLVFEEPGAFRFSIEGLYVGEQRLSDGNTGKDYVIAGALFEKMFRHFNLFISGENLTNVRQNRFDAIYTGSPTHPLFRDIYAPLEGRIINGGVKIRL